MFSLLKALVLETATSSKASVRNYDLELATNSLWLL